MAHLSGHRICTYSPLRRVHNIIKTTPQRLNQHGLEEIKRQQIAKAQALFDT